MSSHDDFEFRVLGPLVVVRGGSEVALPRRRQRQVLALLLLNVGHVVPAERLMEELWRASSHPVETGPLRTNIWELRRLLQPERGTNGHAADGEEPGEVLVSRDTGYVLAVERNQIDSTHFEALFADARAAAASGRSERALARIDDALALWRGPAFGDLTEQLAIRGEAVRLDRLLLAAQELRADLLVTLGDHARVAEDLGALVRANPERERMWAMLMTALYRSGRQSDALRCFQEARTTLIETVGIEPGPDLQRLEDAILRHDPTLDWQPPPAPRIGDEPATRPPSVSSISQAAGDPNEAPPETADRASGPVRPCLPRQLTSLVGRDAERVTVAQLIDSSRLVTLSGSGGCGKTRLALAVAEEMQPRFPGGAWIVDLSAVSDSDLIAGALADSFGVEVDPIDRLDSVCRRISGDRTLLVLDSCEHLADSVAEHAGQLLVRCGALHILATSREELRLGGETVWRVPELSLPMANSDTSPLTSEAVELFIERGRLALAGFAPTGEALEAVGQICRRLDGMPLAIELAAALVGSLPVADIAERLDDRFRLLTDGRRDGVSRHQTLRAALDWSFDALDGPDQTLLAKLGVFVDTFTLPAAEAVTGSDPDPTAVARGLGHLVRTSMVDCVSSRDGAQRYRMLETIRQYACERLEELHDANDVRRRHAHYYKDLAIEAESQVHGPEASIWLAHVASELPNLRAALAWGAAHDNIEIALDLASSLHRLFAQLALTDDVTRKVLRDDFVAEATRPQAGHCATPGQDVTYEPGFQPWTTHRALGRTPAGFGHNGSEPARTGATADATMPW